MSDRTKHISLIIATIVIIMLLTMPFLVREVNTWWFDVKKADDATKYETLKQVEDTCRAMIASYQTDKLTHEQYKESGDKEKQSWSEQAKMRANKTASVYNNYMLENSFLWQDNIPNDIKDELDYIE